MSHFNNILEKLEAFIKRYYTNELIKGSILFFSLGFLFFLITLLVEYFLWLNTSFRSILFWAFIIVELLLFFKFIARPLLKLLKLDKGIAHKDASKIIGSHFPEVNDKLLNVLQLRETHSDSELLLASIEQKSKTLTPIPFKLAVNFKKNIKYLKYAAIPILIFISSYVSDKFNWFNEGFERVVNYQTAYAPPAPFEFFIINSDLTTIENKSFKVLVKTVGAVFPENIQIEYNAESYYMSPKELGAFEYTFSQPKNDISFKLSANGITSKEYSLHIIKAPTISSFNMILNYPSYTKKTDEKIKNTGNAIVSQGTKITWQIKTNSTNAVQLFAKDTLAFNSDKQGFFELTKQLYDHLDYSISASNTSLKNYENLGFNIKVVKDEYPKLNVTMKTDSLDRQSLYFYGQASDDFGLSKLTLVYYPTDNESNIQKHPIFLSKSTFQEFISSFPNDLKIKDGISYKLYFQLFDNDAANGSKSVKSNVFTYRKRTQDEEQEKLLKQQSNTISDLDRSLEKLQDRENELDQLSKTHKEKSSLNFNDKQKLKSFLKRQKEQEKMMQNFNKKLKENLEAFQKEKEKKDSFKKDLQERLNQNEEQLKKDEKLLEELEKLQEKIDKQELNEKLEKLAKQNKNKKRSLEQLLELTKKYYVDKKLEKLQKNLEKLAKEQDVLSKKNDSTNSKKEQDALNEKFEDFKKEMDSLQKENKALKQPAKIPRDKPKEDAVEKDQKEASKSLEQRDKSSEKEAKKEQQKSANEKQKEAAKKMKKMSSQMQMSMDMKSGEQLKEDIEMLRQILDNLLVFSFDEESLMKQFKTMSVNNNQYASNLIKQKVLREHFEHIDDSLFALSLRQPKLSEIVNKEITEVYYNTDKSLERFSENAVYQGVSNMQYVITSANNLADFLSGVLDNLQMSSALGLGGTGENGKGKGTSGKGDGKSDQLPDIIMSQEKLNEKMKKGMSKGEQGAPKEGKQGKEQGEGKKGQKQGQQSGNQEGNEGLNGELYQIYQQQQQLRQALQNKLAEQGIGASGNKLLKEIENIELELLNKGFTKQTLEKMIRLKHELLKLENANLKQGKDNKRESKTNKEAFNNTSTNSINTAKQYFNTTEILNKQNLPLHQIYKKKVQTYFKQTND